MYNPETQTFDDAHGFLQAVRQAFPDVHASTGRNAACDVCTNGAVLLYCVEHKLVDVDKLVAAVEGDLNDPAFGGLPGPIQRPDDDQPRELWRFPSPWIVQELLMQLNPRLDKDTAWHYASNAVTANDRHDFDGAETLIELALNYNPRRPICGN